MRRQPSAIGGVAERRGERACVGGSDCEVLVSLSTTGHNSDDGNERTSRDGLGRSLSAKITRDVKPF